MECNKDEAIRAKEIAVRKMENKDFGGARKILLRAQQLYRDLENVSQMLTICEVHCSDEQKLFGNMTDWYRVLQVERTADETSIKKQFRKLALVLHPDKNKFAGAEAAFKLVGEAQRLLLSDQRSAYDMKLKMGAAAPKQQPRAPNMGPVPPKVPKRRHPSGKQPGVQNTSVNGSNQQSTGFVPPPQQQCRTFWTMCPDCRIRYEYTIDALNKVIACQNCKRHFMARIMETQSWPPGTSNFQTFSQQKVFPGQPDANVGTQNTPGISTATATKPFPKPESNSGGGVGSAFKGKEEGGVNVGVEKKSEKVPKFTKGLSRKGKSAERTNKKRGTNDSCSGGGGIDTETGEVVKENGRPSVSQNTTFTGPRKSPRKKQNTTSNEDACPNEGLINPLKRAKIESSNASEEKTTDGKQGKPKQETILKFFKKEGSVTKEKEKEEATIHPERNFPNGNNETEKTKTTGAKASSPVVNPKSESSHKTEPDPEFVEYPDPDFNDFDKERAGDCFAVDQIWAVYDNSDSMPRFYARIKNVVHSPGFKLRITWLEPVFKRQEEKDWFGQDLPIACGIFKLENTQNTEDRLMFSHLISWEKGTSKGSYMIFPRKGETWALFKDWDINWKFDPENHRKYEFEFVEVISDYAEKKDIEITYLNKVKGFRCLFKQTPKKAVVPSTELLRFSHRIPSFRMTGREREGVPEGSFEFDPASFHVNLASDGQEDHKVECNATKTKSQAEGVESLKATMRPSIPKVVINLEEEILHDSKVPKRTDVFSTEPNGKKEKSPPTQSQCPTKEKIRKRPHCLKDDSHGDGSVPVDESLKADVKKSSLDSSIHRLRPSPSSSLEPEEVPETIFFNFDSNRCLENFKPGQVWALYSDEDGFPKYYARISKVEAIPNLKLHITWLASCPKSKNVLRWSDENMPVACGVFRILTCETVYTTITAFSHQVRVESSGRNKYEIFPKKGDIWALFKDFNPKWTSSELAKCDYDIVEVLKDDRSEIKVVFLKQVDGFKTVFRAQAIGGSGNTLTIPRNELVRFSHQIPAFLLVEENNGYLKGCWELDPASFPVTSFT